MSERDLRFVADEQHGERRQAVRLQHEALRLYSAELRHGRESLRAQLFNISEGGLGFLIMERDPPLEPGFRVQGALWGPGLELAHEFLGEITRIEDAPADPDFTLVAIALENGESFPVGLIASAVAD